MNIQNSSSATAKKPRFFYGYVIVAIGVVMMILSWGSYYSFGVFFTPLLNEFSWSRATTSGAFSLASIIEGLACIITGKVTDKHGPRIVMTVSGLLIGLSYLLMGHVSAIWQVYLFYGLLNGIGMSGPIAALAPTVARWFVGHRGLLTGILLAGIGAGAIVIPPAANYLITVYDWRQSYSTLGIVILVTIVILAQFLRRDPSQMGLRPYHEEKEQEMTFTASRRSYSFPEARGMMQFWAISGITAAAGFTLFAIMVHLVRHALDLEISASSAATLISIIGVCSIGGKILMGHLCDKIGGRRCFMSGFALMSLTFFWLLFADNILTLTIFAAVFGLAYGGCTAPQPPLLTELFGLKNIGFFMGTTNFTFAIGGSLGPLIAGYIFDTTGSYQLAFVICGIVAMIGLILAFIIRPTNGQTATAE